MGELGWTASLGSYQKAVDAALVRMADERVMPRLWARDHTLWKPQPTEITNRLGWLHIAEEMREALPGITALADAARQEGYTHALLLGMGGSSLAPEVFAKTYGAAKGHLELAVLDSTDPGAVLAFAETLDPARTLFLVSTKSGGTVETLSAFKYFYNWVARAVGAEAAGRHFVAITDPGSSLAALAERYRFRQTFLNDPNIGGRYSALSYFGLVPAALLGVDLAKLLERAIEGACGSDACVTAHDNPAARLGAVIGELAKAGRDKLTLITSPAIASLGDWVEQLVAESVGKEGKGVLPVVGEPVGAPAAYGSDRLFVYLTVKGDRVHGAAVRALEQAGQPVVRLTLGDRYDLGGQFFIWELATAVVGYLLEVNPFDQPNVESAKVRAREMVAAYAERGALPAEQPALTAEGVAVYGDVAAKGPGEALRDFLAMGQGSGYVSVQAYIQSTPAADQALRALRLAIRERYKLAVTVGYGPRFLHSTGQLHKGDAGNGLFIQVTADDSRDARIPDEAGKEASAMSFSVLKAAQALGDRQALLDAGRRVIRFHLGTDAAAGLRRLARALGGA